MGRGERGSAEQRAAADGAGREGQRAAEFCGHSSLRVVACRAITVLFVFKIVLNVCFVSFCKVPLLRRSSQQGYFAKRNKTNIEYYFEYKQNSYRATRDHTQRTVATEFGGALPLSPRPIGSCSLFGASPLAPPHRQLLFLRRCLSRSAPSAAALC